MGTISLSLPSDGQTIDASDVNNPFNTIANEINGNLSNANIASNAAIDRSKISGFTDGWESLGYTPSTVTCNGNRSYDLTFSSVDLTGNISKGMRLKLTRTVTAPTQCTDLESGSSQYFSKTSPTGLAFTTTFTCSAWIKLESYGAVNGIIARRNADTEGFSMYISATGQLGMQGLRIASNFKTAESYQSVPLNKWTHVAISMDMTAGATSGATWYIDGVSVPGTVVQTGTATAIVQGTTALVVGAQKSAGTSPFDGKIAQAAVFSSVLSDATIKAMMNQTMTGSETNLVSAYTFNNSINDLSANANNLTANGSAVATNADTPFTNPVTNTSITAGTTNYAIVTAASFSTNTTLTVQIPEGETLPTSGGVSAVSYSTQKIPYGFPGQKGKWRFETILATQRDITSTTTYENYNVNLLLPIGAWTIGWQGVVNVSKNATTFIEGRVSLSDVTASFALPQLTARIYDGIDSENKAINTTNHLTLAYNATTQTTLYMVGYNSIAAQTLSLVGGTGNYLFTVFAENDYL